MRGNVAYMASRPSRVASMRGSISRVAASGGGTGSEDSHKRSDRICGSAASRFESAVVPVRGSPMMQTGPSTCSPPICGWAAQVSTTRRRLASSMPRRCSRMTAPRSVSAASASTAATSRSRPSRDPVGGPEVGQSGCRRWRRRPARRRPASAGRAHTKSDPPSTFTLAPVTYPFVLLARKTTVAATSSGRPAVRDRRAGGSARRSTASRHTDRWDRALRRRTRRAGPR